MQSAQAAGCFYSVLQRAKRMILSVEKLSHSYGVRTLFKDVTFNIEMGDKIGIIGVNGTGKSTLLRDIARGEAGDGGRITANGSCVIEYLPQNPDYDPQATVLEQVFQGDSPQLELLRRYERAAALAVRKYDALQECRSRQCKTVSSILFLNHLKSEQFP